MRGAPGPLKLPCRCVPLLARVGEGEEGKGGGLSVREPKVYVVCMLVCTVNNVTVEDEECNKEVTQKGKWNTKWAVRKGESSCDGACANTARQSLPDRGNTQK